MPFSASFLYPNDDDLIFNKVYYLSSHMPLMQRQFVKHGLKSWEAVEYKPGLDGAKPAYILGVTLVFDSPDQFSAALSSEDAKAIFADMPNYTNKQPICLSGDLVERVDIAVE